MRAAEDRIAEHDRFFPLGAGRDDVDRALGQLFQARQVAARFLGQVAIDLHARRGLGPARPRFIHRLADAQHHTLLGDLRQLPVALELVPRAEPDLAEAVEDVQLGDAQRGQPVHPDRVADQHGVVPSAPALPSGDGAEFIAALLQRCAEIVGELGGKGPAPHAGRIGLGYSEHRIHGGRAHARAGAGAAGRRARRGHIGIGAVVHVQVRALRALQQDHLALRNGLVDQQTRIHDHALQPVGVAQIFLEDLLRLEPRRMVERLQQRVRLRHIVFQLLAEIGRVQQIPHADSDPGHLVDVRRPDAAAGRADAPPTLLGLARLLDCLVVRHDHVRGLADVEMLVGPHALGLQAVYFRDQVRRVDDHAVADYAGRAAVQHPRRDQLEDVLVPALHHRVAGIRSALVADDHVGILGQQVHDLALAFVAPLGADHHQHAHRLHNLLT